MQLQATTVCKGQKRQGSSAFWLAVFVLLSALGVVYCKHLNRQLFIRLESLVNYRDQLQVEWGRLLLEEGTLTAHTRIEQIARERLEMELPSESKVVIVKHEP